MRIPFWPRRRPTELVVTFTQEIDLEAVASGAPVNGGSMALAIACPCGETIDRNGAWTMTRTNSVTVPYACRGCGNKVTIIYTTDVKQAEAV